MSVKSGVSEKVDAWINSSDYNLRQWKKYEALRLYYKYRAENELDPKGATVIVGDSLVDNWDLQKYFPKGKLINRGIGGDMTAGVLARLDDIIALEPRRVILLIGTNDVAWGYDYNEILKKIAQIVALLNYHCPDCYICVLGLLPVAKDCESRNNVNITAVNQNLGKLNNGGFLKCEVQADIGDVLLCAKSGKRPDITTLRDKLETTTGFIDPAYTTDGLHLSDYGYRVLSKAVERFVDCRS